MVLLAIKTLEKGIESKSQACVLLAARLKDSFRAEKEEERFPGATSQDVRPYHKSLCPLLLMLGAGKESVQLLDYVKGQKEDEVRSSDMFSDLVNIKCCKLPMEFQ